MLFARASTKDVGKMRVADLLRVGNSEVELREVAPLHPLLPGREPSLNIAARCPAARSRKASELPFREARNSLWFRLGHPVELRGVEPRSRQAANMLSTRLASRSVVGKMLDIKINIDILILYKVCLEIATIRHKFSQKYII